MLCHSERSREICRDRFRQRRTNARPVRYKVNSEYDMTKNFFPTQKILFSITILLLVFSKQLSSADTVHTTDGDEIKTVVLRKNMDNIVISSVSGELTIKMEDIKNIDYEDEIVNLFFLADLAKEQQDYTKAYYTYEKILKNYPESEEAIRGIIGIKDHLKELGPDIKWVSNYRRYRNQVSKTGNEQHILRDNAEVSENLKDEFGLILGVERGNGRIKVLEAIKGSPANEAGIKINDYLMSINGNKVIYMGLFDVIGLLRENDNIDKHITVERELRLWIESEEETPQTSLLDLIGLSLKKIGHEIIIDVLKENSWASKAELQVGDVFVYARSELIQAQYTPDKVERLIRGTGTGSVDIIIRRVLAIKK